MQNDTFIKIDFFDIQNKEKLINKFLSEVRSIKGLEEDGNEVSITKIKNAPDFTFFFYCKKVYVRQKRDRIKKIILKYHLSRVVKLNK